MVDDFQNDTKEYSENSSSKGYDWLDDPFNDKKTQQKAGMSSKTKLAVGCGCFLIIVIMVIVGIIVLLSLGDLVSVF